MDLIIDCDPGIDDALALFLAAGSSSQLRLCAVTCVTGNRPIERTADNARRVLAAAGRADVPVHAGAAQPLRGPARCSLVHGEDGLGGAWLPDAGPVHGEPAVDALLRWITQSPPGTLTLAAVGPLTNLALAEARQPGVLRRLRALLVMGGAMAGPGNVTPHAEFNFWADAAAARAVVHSGAPITLFGLDVTRQTAMSAAWIDALTQAGGACARAARTMLQSYARFYHPRDPLMHDACPIAYLMHPELFSGRRWALDIDVSAGETEGRVVGGPVGSAPVSAVATCDVMFDVDAAALLTLVADRLARLP